MGTGERTMLLLGVASGFTLALKAWERLSGRVPPPGATPTDPPLGGRPGRLHHARRYAQAPRLTFLPR